MNHSRTTSDPRYYKLLFFLITIGIIGLGYFSWPVDDDYSLAVFFKEHTLLDGVINLYLTWGGRLFNWFLLGIFTPLAHHIFFLSMVLSAFFLYFLNLATNIEPFYSFKRNLRWTFLTIIFATFFMAMRPFLATTVYWPTGGLTYITSFLLGLIWIFCCFNKKRANHWPTTIALIFLGIASSTMLEQTTAALLFISASAFFLMIMPPSPIFSESPLVKDIKKLSKLHTAIRISSIFIGATILYFSPGNTLRSQALNTSMHFSPSDLFSNTISMIAVMLDSSWKKMVLCFFSGLIQICILKAYHLKIILPLQLRYWFIFFISLALATLGPFILMSNHQLIYRYTALPTFILGIMAMGIPYYLVSFLDSKLSFLQKKLYITTLLPLLLLIPALMILLLDYATGFKFERQMNQRAHIIKENTNSERNNDLFLPAITSYPPRPIHFVDFDKNPNSWVNQSAAKFYNLQTIQVRP